MGPVMIFACQYCCLPCLSPLLASHNTILQLTLILPHVSHTHTCRSPSKSRYCAVAVKGCLGISSRESKILLAQAEQPRRLASSHARPTHFP